MAPPLIHLDTGFVIRSLYHGSDEEAQLNQWTSRKVRLGISAVARVNFFADP